MTFCLIPPSPADSWGSGCMTSSSHSFFRTFAGLKRSFVSRPLGGGVWSLQRKARQCTCRARLLGSAKRCSSSSCPRPNLTLTCVFKCGCFHLLPWQPCSCSMRMSHCCSSSAVTLLSPNPLCLSHLSRSRCHV